LLLLVVVVLLIDMLVIWMRGDQHNANHQHRRLSPVAQQLLRLMIMMLSLLQYVNSRGIAPGPNATQKHPNPYVSAFLTAAGPPEAAYAAAFAAAAAAAEREAAAAAGGAAFGAAGAAGGQVLFGKAAQQPQQQQQQQQTFGSAGETCLCHTCLILHNT
jgi:hypothetical protein